MIHNFLPECEEQKAPNRLVHVQRSSSNAAWAWTNILWSEITYLECTYSAWILSHTPNTPLLKLTFTARVDEDFLALIPTLMEWILQCSVYAFADNYFSTQSPHSGLQFHPCNVFEYNDFKNDAKLKQLACMTLVYKIHYNDLISFTWCRVFDHDCLDRGKTLPSSS